LYNTFSEGILKYLHTILETGISINYKDPNLNYGFVFGHVKHHVCVC